MRVWAAATYLMRLGGPMSQPWGWELDDVAPWDMAEEEAFGEAHYRRANPWHKSSCPQSPR